MFFSRALLAGVALFSFASAQNTRVAFTSVPAVVVGGETYNITWGGGDGTSVTITLRKGNPNDLETIGNLADSVEGNSYNWTVPRSLEAGDDYALQITQGQDQINYSGQFSLVEANSTSTSSASMSATTSSNSSMTTTIGLGSNGTATGNSTMSTSSLPRTMTTTPMTSARSTPSATAGSPSAISTSAPDSSDSSNGAMQMTSSAAFVIGVIAAVMFLS